MKSHDEGYTLTEMLVVIGIIGLLAAVLTPVLIGQLGRARAKAARLQIENVAASVEMFRSDVGRYPTTAEGLPALVAQPQDAEGWLGPYLRNEKALADPWGRSILYRFDVEQAQASISSLGADGKEGGRGVNADLVTP